MTKKHLGLHEIENELRAKCARRGWNQEHTDRFVKATLDKIKRQKQRQEVRQE